MTIQSASPYQAAIFASGYGHYSIEWVLIGFAVVVSIQLWLVRVKRAHDQKLRKAASTGFYDFDVAHYAHSSSESLATGAPVAPGGRSLSPTFTSSARGEATKPRTAPVAPLPVPSTFADVDRSFASLLPEFDRLPGPEQRLPIPSTQNIEPPPPPPTSPNASLPLLEQPPPPTPDPRSD